MKNPFGSIRLRPAQDTPRSAPQIQPDEIAMIKDVHTGRSVDTDDFMSELRDYVERVELDPSVPTSILDVAEMQDWNLMLAAGLGPRLVVLTAACAHLVLMRHWMRAEEEPADLVQASLELLEAETEDRDSLPAIGITRIVLVEQTRSQYALDPDDVPGLRDVEDADLLRTILMILAVVRLIAKS